MSEHSIRGGYILFVKTESRARYDQLKVVIKITRMRLLRERLPPATTSPS